MIGLLEMTLWKEGKRCEIARFILLDCTHTYMHTRDVHNNDLQYLLLISANFFTITVDENERVTEDGKEIPP